MPLHFNDLDVVSEVAGISSALIVPCYMCPAVTVAVREKEPFIQFFNNFLKSAPFEEYMRALQSRLRENGVNTKVLRASLLTNGLCACGLQESAENYRNVRKNMTLRWFWAANLRPQLYAMRLNQATAK